MLRLFVILLFVETCEFQRKSVQNFQNRENKEATVRPWEKQWNSLKHGETVRIERSVVEAFEFEFLLIFLASTFFPVSIVLLPKIGSHHLINLWINIFDSDLEVHFRFNIVYVLVFVLIVNEI